MRRIFAGLVVLCFGFVSVVWSASVTVAKPPVVANFTTVQAGLVAAGNGGTVTILDSSVYVEDVTITQLGVTITVAPGQRPTIRAANAINRYGAIGITSNDHFGLSVMGPCLLNGLNIENNDSTVNTHATFGPLAASAIIIHSPLVTLQNCKIFGPGGPFGAGDWVACLVVGLQAGPPPVPAAATLQNCEVYGAEYGAVDETFQVANPALPDSFLTLINCDIHDNTASGLQIDAGVTTATGCTIHNNNTGVGAGGGRLFLIGCDIKDSNSQGMDIDFNSSFARAGDSCRVKVTNSLLYANGSTQSSIDLRDGTLNIDHSIISLGGDGGIWLSGDDPTNAFLNMDFCDVFAPGKSCIHFDTTATSPAYASIKNSVLMGANGVMCQTGHRANIYNSDVFVTGTAFQNTLTSNTAALDPYYVRPYVAARDGFHYYRDLSVGESGQYVGSQGRWGAAAHRSWSLYK